uniref:Uncharacterized protein n=1 Tax=viral metagenome TaxID=1070528 RepID=A0A6C0BB63_9ZZZZ
MANTRFFYDRCRVEKQLQESTDQGKWILNVPGNGDRPDYIADPQIRIQSWGANLMTNSVDLESELLGVNRRAGTDCLGIDQYNNKKYSVPSKKMNYPTNTVLTTEQSRVITPAWMVRDVEQVDWYYPPLNPQENTCMPFLNNVSTRILEKDYFVQKIPCLNQDTMLFPVPLNFQPQQTKVVN